MPKLHTFFFSFIVILEYIYISLGLTEDPNEGRESLPYRLEAPRRLPRKKSKPKPCAMRSISPLGRLREVVGGSGRDRVGVHVVGTVVGFRDDAFSRSVCFFFLFGDCFGIQ